MFDFYNAENIALLWEYVGILLKGVAPGVMISAAISAVGIVLVIVARAFHSATKKDEDEDYEYKEY